MKAAESLKINLASYFFMANETLTLQNIILIKWVCHSTILPSPNSTYLHGSFTLSVHKVIINIYGVLLGAETHPGKRCSHVTINYSVFLNICSVLNDQNRLKLVSVSQLDRF